LREQIKNGTPLGKEAMEFVNSGQLVPDKLLLGIIELSLLRPDCKKVMFDGFPRTAEQAKKVSFGIKISQKA